MREGGGEGEGGREGASEYIYDVMSIFSLKLRSRRGSGFLRSVRRTGA